MTVQSIVVLGGGSAGLIVAATLKRKLPQLKLRVLRSPEIGVIGVGEGTTASFPRHFFEYLRLNPQPFYSQAEPTWKLGLKFLWGGPRAFYYTFAYEFQHRYPECSRNNGFFFNPEQPSMGKVSAFMSQDRAFPRRSDGLPEFHNHHAFHVENKKLVGWLESTCRELGVEVTDATVRVEVAGDGSGVAALLTEKGERVTADFFVDASGFRSELVGQALSEPFRSYTDALFCDRALIAGWPRADEPILPYTTAETMNAGWCWRIEHEHWINRGYVYASSFLSDNEARAEFLAKNPKVRTEPRLVTFRSGRLESLWVGNTVAVGNAAGFVEPLEATALQVICVEASTLADALVDSLCAPTPTLIQLYNDYNARAWDDIRDFLAIHYRFNRRLDTPFWRACQNDVALHGAEFLVQFYRENGPSVVAASEVLHPSNSFGMDGYLAMLLGQGVPHGKSYSPTPVEEKVWRERRNSWELEARRGLDVKQCLEAIRRSGLKRT
jgi:tryptophan 7-halogenase